MQTRTGRSRPGIASVTRLPWVDDVVSAKRDRVLGLLSDGGPGVMLEPIANLRTWKIIGHEAQPAFDTGKPESWFDDASEAGLTHHLESAILDSTLDVLTTTPVDTFLTLRLSPSTIQTGVVRDLIGHAGAHRLVVELEAPSDRVDEAEDGVDELRASGVRFAFGEIGAGFAPLHEVLRLEPDFVKIGADLVGGIDTDPKRRALAETIVAFARKTGCVLIAAGIENDAELETLLSLGVRYGQGPRIGRTKLVLSPYGLRSGTEWVAMPALEPKYHSRRRRRTAIAAIAASLAISASASAAALTGGPPDPSRGTGVTQLHR